MIYIAFDITQYTKYIVNIMPNKIVVSWSFFSLSKDTPCLVAP